MSGPAIINVSIDLAIQTAREHKSNKLVITI